MVPRWSPSPGLFTHQARGRCIREEINARRGASEERSEARRSRVIQTGKLNYARSEEEEEEERRRVPAPAVINGASTARSRSKSDDEGATGASAERWDNRNRDGAILSILKSRSRASGRESSGRRRKSRVRARAEWREGQFKYLSRDGFSLRTISEPQNPTGRVYAGSRGEKSAILSSCHPTAACWNRYSRDAELARDSSPSLASLGR